MKHPNRNGKAQQRRDSAAERQATYEQLSLSEKVARARKRGGIKCREFLRLKALI